MIEVPLPAISGQNSAEIKTVPKVGYYEYDLASLPEIIRDAILER
jgi:hypothetical protein